MGMVFVVIDLFGLHKTYLFAAQVTSFTTIATQFHSFIMFLYFKETLIYLDKITDTLTIKKLF